MTPEQERVALRIDPASNPGLSTLRAELSSGKESEDRYLEWRRHPYTRMFLRALVELADSPPPFAQESGETNRILLQYGMTSGLNLAVKLLSQPHRVYPEIFTVKKGKAQDDGLDQSFTDTLDDVLDGM